MKNKQQQNIKILIDVVYDSILNKRYQAIHHDEKNRRVACQ
ncbi:MULTISPECIES: hypothetical protein [Photorhabdus]|nr:MULTISPECIES: hypothetical protein [Photorhabdus]